jgi:hypothetical protein
VSVKLRGVTMKDLLSKIKSDSRLEQFETFREIFLKCFEERNREIKTYFEEFLVKWK